MSLVLRLAEKLIRCPSVTPNDAGCQSIISEHLNALHFQIEALPFNGVDNLWARLGTTGPLLVFAGHTDVVPTGPIDAWISDPFTPTLRNELLYGRGASDMKGGLAAMLAAVHAFLQEEPHFKGSIGFLITSDEEGPTNQYGTKKVMEVLHDRKEKIDYCIVGEASSDKILGDQIRIGRRGSISCKLAIYGQQGHVAFPHLARNPIHLATPALTELVNVTWDNGNEFFPATTFQISNIHSGTGASNVIPGILEASFNLRFGTAISVAEIQERVTHILEKHGLDFKLQWEVSGLPFLTPQGKLITTVKESIKKITGQDTLLSTGGGTSDGRFIAPYGVEVIELGPRHESVHQVNEHVSVADLETLTRIYKQLLQNLLT